MMWLVFSVFFFQAEDGIRDWSVTGVQTCALPISLRLLNRRLGSAPPKRSGPKIIYEPKEVLPVLKAVWLASDQLRRCLKRSEERRVGKECRCRGGRVE